MSRRATHALVEFGELLAPHEEALDVPWAEFVDDTSSEASFTVDAADTEDAYLQIQAYDVGNFDHEVLLNGEPLSGFDIPPSPGWQCWMDSVSGASLTGGENTLRVRRDDTTDDAFVVGTATVHWKEPVD